MISILKHLIVFITSFYLNTAAGFAETPAGRRRSLSSSTYQQSLPAEMIQRYELWSSQLIMETVTKWADHYHDLIRVTTSQDEYGLPAAGGPSDCPFEKDEDGCKNYILTIQDFVAHPEGSDSSNRLPEVLWSGEVHGNERVGPTAVLEATGLLLDAAHCESFPRLAMKGTGNWEEEVANAKDCRDKFEKMGISDWERRWLARLVTTRRIVVVPTANALGYFREEREENGVDPNRDFPYDLKDPKACMVTIAARTLNEVFREHMFQLSLTMHGGMEVIGYEWGAPSYKGKTSPDDTAQAEISEAYSRFGGGWKRSRPYQHGNMNDLVYPVRGGMEDWAYAGSWDTDRVIQCDPDTFDGYPAEKTTYGPSTLRVFNMLVESSDDKIPTSDLGTSAELLIASGNGTGFVSRNMRLALLAAEMVEPYAVIREVNELELTDDLVPLMDRSGRSCQQTKAVQVPHNSRKVVVRWTVGGALTIDETKLWYGKWSDIEVGKLDCQRKPTMEDVKAYLKEATMISATSGTGKFSKSDSSGAYSASFEIDGYAAGDQLVVLASARVDQAWGTKLQGVSPDVPPQSHIVNARTNSSWYHESNGKIIQGRLDWFSDPLTVVLAQVAQGEVETIELSSRISEDTGGDGQSKPDSGTPTGKTVEPTKPGDRFVSVLLFVVVAVVLGFAGRAYLKSRMRQARRAQVREFIEDPDAPTPGLRHKDQRTTRRNGYTDIADAENGEVEMGEYT